MSENGLKYAITLPLQPGVAQDIRDIIEYAEKAIPGWVERYKARAVKRKRESFGGWFLRKKTDEEVLKVIENEEYFWGWDYVTQCAMPYGMQDNTIEAMESILALSEYYDQHGSTGFAYNSRRLFEHITSGVPNSERP